MLRIKAYKKRTADGSSVEELSAVHTPVTRSQGIASHCSSSPRRLRLLCLLGRAKRSSGLHPQMNELHSPGSPVPALRVNRVADRSLTLHAEALTQRGRGTQQAPPARSK